MRYPLREFTNKTRGIVLKKAVDLVNRNMVEPISKEVNHSHFHVHNFEQKFYHVEVVFEGEEVVFTHCDCSYRGIGLCKHIAGSLLMELAITGFKPEMLTEDDFVYHDEEVVTKVDDEAEAVQALFEEMMRDPEFNFAKFIALQNKEGLQGFIMKYMDQTEDLRMIMFAYLWYKKSNAVLPNSIVS
ncbi:MAG: hypothetical protein E4G74_00725 [Erysipelotrichales bacterium]|nr:MAG: hypothetical protein E4G74_00725 [Erysipelotrichales bacterium]